MNYIKAQENIFKALIKEEHRVCRFDFDEEHTFITPDGTHGWIFPNDILWINIEKIQQFKGVEIASIIKPENKLELTCDFTVRTPYPKELLRKLRNDKKTVWVKDAFLALFQDPEFYQELDESISHVVVTERVRGKVKPVGVVLPVRINKSDEI